MLSRPHIFKGHLVCASESCQDPSLLLRYGVPRGLWRVTYKESKGRGFCP